MKLHGVRAVLVVGSLVAAFGCTSDTERIVGAWRVDQACSRLPAEVTGNANAFAGALATAMIANMRFQYGADAQYASFAAGQTITGRWQAEDGVLRTVDAAGQASEAQYEFADERMMLTTNPDTTLCLRHETEAEAAAIVAAAEAQAAEAERVAAAAAAREQQMAAARELATVELQGVDVLPVDFQQNRFMERLVFRLRISNTTTQAITALRGRIVYMNAFGEPSANLTVTSESPIAAGAASDVRFELDYNQFLEAHQALRRFQAGRTQVRWEPTDVVLADGTRVSAPAPE
jgi:hypothetical protein